MTNPAIPGLPPGFPVQQPPAAPAQPAAAPAQPQVAGAPKWAQQVAGATVGNQSGDYFSKHEDGLHVVDLVEMKIVDSVNSGELFTVEFVVVETTSPNLRVGSERTWQCATSTKPGGADVLRFHHLLFEYILAQNGQVFDPETMPLTPQTLAHGVSSDQPYKGFRFQLETKTKPQKRDPSKDFTHHRFQILDPGTVLGLQPQGQVAQAPPAPAPQATPAPAPQATPPPGWPQGLPWPPQGAGQ